SRPSSSISPSRYSMSTSSSSSSTDRTRKVSSSSLFSYHLPGTGAYSLLTNSSLLLEGREFRGCPRMRQRDQSLKIGRTDELHASNSCTPDRRQGRFGAARRSSDGPGQPCLAGNPDR